MRSINQGKIELPIQKAQKAQPKNEQWNKNRNNI